MSPKNQKIIVAMSGGIDSSFAAVKLKKQGYNVIGIFLHLGAGKIKQSAENQQCSLDENKCCSREAQERARKVANFLKIPFYTVNAKAEFKKEVVDYFVKEYKNGRTPNPCVVCNQRIKFNFLMRKLYELDADYIATGHYVKVVKNMRPRRIRPWRKLYSAKDKTKDQSYFLYRLTQEQLSRTLFPTADLLKSQVRAYLKKQKVPLDLENQEESQNICFVPQDLTSFLKQYIKLEPGNIVDKSGNILGKHKGLAVYTIGQRKGLYIGGSGPYFVVSKNSKKNELIVSNKEKDLYQKEMQVSDVVWIGEIPKLPTKAYMKIRYRHEKAYAIIEMNKNNNLLTINFNQPQRAITTGQSAVFYTKAGQVLGGGVIV